MSDLIERKDVQDMIVLACRSHDRSDVLLAIRRGVKNIPSVDVVPVVRCRDCRYWRQEVTPTEHWICTQHSSDGRRMHTTPDFYCADGKRMKT